MPIVQEMLRSGASWSGSERDHFFLNAGGEEFVELSGVAGLDSVADGRATAVLDFDRDGWPDLAVVNANSPQLMLYRNELGGRVEHGSVAVALVGGRRAEGAGTEGGGPGAEGPSFSNRDAIGATLALQVGERLLRREIRAGEGFASQSSRRVTFGLGSASRAEALSVRWPGGREQRIEDVPVGSFVRVFEDPARSPDGSGFAITPFVGSEVAPTRSDVPAAAPELAGFPRRDDATLHLYTSTATWCVACAAEVDDLARLRAAFGEDQLALLGVAVDPADDAASLRAWSERFGAEHEILVGLPPEDLEAFEQAVLDRLKRPGLPAALIADADGRIVHAQFGPPTVSTIRRLLDAAAKGR